MNILIYVSFIALISLDFSLECQCECCIHSVYPQGYLEFLGRLLVQYPKLFWVNDPVFNLQVARVILWQICGIFGD